MASQRCLSDLSSGRSKWQSALRQPDINSLHLPQRPSAALMPKSFNCTTIARRLRPCEANPFIKGIKRALNALATSRRSKVCRSDWPTQQSPITMPQVRRVASSRVLAKIFRWACRGLKAHPSQSRRHGILQ